MRSQFVSALTENQILAFILAFVVCLALYGIGTDLVVGLFSDRTATLLRALGTGSRFDSIARGVVDLRRLPDQQRLLRVLDSVVKMVQMAVRIVGTDEAGLCAEIDVEESADIDDIDAEIRHRVQAHLAPRAVFRTLLDEIEIENQIERRDHNHDQ